MAKAKGSAGSGSVGQAGDHSGGCKGIGYRSSIPSWWTDASS
jgi:hypothetical protein